MVKTIVCGNLTADPVLSDRKWTNRETGEIFHAKVCNFTVAANDTYGDSKEPTFFRVAAWRGQAELCAKYLTKGRPVVVEGPVKLNKYTDKNGDSRAVMEIRANEVQFLGARPAAEAPVTPAETYSEPEDADDVPW